MTGRQQALDDITALTDELATTELRRAECMDKARALGARAEDVAAAAKMPPATYYRLAGKRRDKDRAPGRFRDIAPALVIAQPGDGLSVGIGTDLSVPPLATFTFTAATPVLLLLRRDTVDVWPVIATSVTVSDARVRIYGRPPHARGGPELPNYLGVWGEFDGHLDLINEFASRIARINAGENLAPILVHLLATREGLAAVNTALTFGHQARIYLIVEHWRWQPHLGVINSVLALGGVGTGDWATTLPAAGPPIPNRFDAATLTTPAGTEHLVLQSVPDMFAEC